MGLQELIVYKYNLVSIRIDCMNQQGVADQKFSLAIDLLCHSHDP